MLSNSVPWQMKNNDEFHKDLATGRNEKKGSCVCLPVQDSVLPGPLAQSARDLQPSWFRSTAVTPDGGGRGRGFISLFLVRCDFCLNLKSENEKKVSNTHNRTS